MKKLYLFFLIIVCLFTISTVSAEEIDNSTNILSNDYSIEVIESANNDLLGGSYGTFEELQNEINTVENGGTLNLNKNYMYMSGSNNGIKIDKQITINGNGFTIDGNYSSRVFNITANNVILRNLSLINGYCSDNVHILWNGGPIAGAIAWHGDNGLLIDSVVSKNKNSAICWIGNNGKIINSNIIKNTDSNNGGGGIIWIGDNGTIIDSKILSNIASQNSGGGIVWHGNDGFIANTLFFNNTECNAATAGGIQWCGDNGFIKNCSFINNSATDANSISWIGENGLVTDSYFLENRAYYPIKWHGKNGTFCNSEYLINSKFLWYGDYGKVINITFLNSTPNIEWKGKYGKFSPTIIANDLTKTFLEDTRFYAKFFDNYAKPLDYVDIEFYVNGNYYTKKTNELGIADLDINLVPGKYDIISHNTGTDENLTNKIIVLSGSKSDSICSIDNISTVYYSNQSIFIVNVNSKLYEINEGKVEFYVNDEYIGLSDVNDGIAIFKYTAPDVGTYNLKVVFPETDNFLSSSSTSTFKVVKMPTRLLGNTIIFDDMDTKNYNISLVDLNNKGISNKFIYLQVIKYSGQYYSFVDETNSDGIVTFDIDSLDGGIWYVSSNFEGDDKYVDSSLEDKFIIIKMETFTEITGIDNTYIGHPMHFSANVYDEFGDLVNEGVVHFYLNGKDLGYIDLEKRSIVPLKLSNIDLLGIGIDYCIMGVDDNSDLYIEYIPKTVGDYSLDVIYEGTNMYKSSNKSSTFVVTEEKGVYISAPDITKYYTGPERFIVTLTEDGNPLPDNMVYITINGFTYTRTTDQKGQASIAINLIPGVYDVKVTYEDKSVDSKITIFTTVCGEDVVKIYKNDTQYYATFLDSEGNYLVKGTSVQFNLNGVFYTKEIIDNKGTAKLDINEKPGNYIVTTSNPVTSEMISNIITVLSNIVENSDLTKYYNETSRFSVRIIAPNGNYATGQKVKFTIGNITYESTSDSKGYAYLNARLQPGTYIVKTSFNDNDVNNVIKILATINDQDMKVSSSNIIEGENEIIKIVLPDDATGKVNTKINGKEYSANVNNGNANIVISNLKHGVYDVTVIYGGDSQYNSVKGTTSFIVDKNIDLSVPDVTKYYGGSERLYVYLKDKNNQPISHADVKINLNGVDYTRTTDEKGIVSMGINLNSGNYNVKTEYGGAVVYSTVTIKDTIISKDFSKIFRNATQYQGKFVDSQGNLLRNVNVEFNINGVMYTRTTDNNGIASMNINLNPGTYVLTALNPSTGQSRGTTITVLSSIVENYDLTKYYKNASQYSVRILDGQGKPVGEGVSVVFNINGVFYTRTSNGEGYVNMNINLNPGTYIITAEYNGLSTSNTIRVLSILSGKDISMIYRDGTKFEEKLLDGQGNPFPNQLIKFNVNGVFYERITDENGIASLNINLPSGEYIITAEYNGLSRSNIIKIGNNPNSGYVYIDLPSYDTTTTIKSGIYTIEVHQWRSPGLGEVDIMVSDSNGFVNKYNVESKVFDGSNWHGPYSSYEVAAYHKWQFDPNIRIYRVAVQLLGLHWD